MNPIELQLGSEKRKFNYQIVGFDFSRPASKSLRLTVTIDVIQFDFLEICFTEPVSTRYLT